MSETNGSIVKDKELAAINRICKELNGLDEKGRERVMIYLVNRYSPNLVNDIIESAQD